MKNSIRGISGDLWGGLAAVLVALPSAIAFGVTVFTPFGAAHAASGAMAGLVGATVMGVVAPLFGGTRRLITAPCAPAAAVLSAFALELSGRPGSSVESAIAMIGVVAALCGGLQLVFGLIGAGRLIKYMPYPVVSGYLSGVGLIVFLSQLPKLLGLPAGAHSFGEILSPDSWQWTGVTVGVVTMAVMVIAPKVTRAVPAAILALAAGALTYFALGAANPALLRLEGNPLVVGSLDSGGSFSDSVGALWGSLREIRFADLRFLVTPALTLAVLLSIDTLKTCVVLDALTRSRHDSNRELVGQGLGNVGAALLGGVPGAGTMGATLVNISAGGESRLSGVVEGVLALAAFVALGSVIAWVPIAALAGILIVIAFRMVDWRSFQLLKSRSTILDFLVIASVVVVAETVSLVGASAVGLGLAILLFVREQIRGSIVRRRSLGDQMFSKQVRLPAERAVLEKNGEKTAIFELQGSLFFGTTDRLLTELEADLGVRNYLVLDMRRVQSIDYTAVHLLERIEDQLASRGARLVFSSLPEKLPTGQEVRQYLDDLGLVRPTSRVTTFPTLNEALEWIEGEILAAERLPGTGDETPLELAEIDFLGGRKETTIAALEAMCEKRTFAAGEKIFQQGEPGDELFLIRRGSVRIVLPLAGGQARHLASFKRGNFFGEMSFLDRGIRSADAVTETETDLFILSRGRFDEMAADHKRLGIQVFEGVARTLALRLRHTNADLRALEEN